MIARARAWLDQWQLNPGVVPALISMLGFMGIANVALSFQFLSMPDSLIFAAVGLSLSGLSVWLSRRRPAEDRANLANMLQLGVVVGMVYSLEPILLGEDRPWLHRLGLWAGVSVAVTTGVEVSNVIMRYVRRRYSDGTTKATRA